MSISELIYSIGSSSKDAVITVVIPTFNRRDNIHTLLKYLATITPHNVQIYIIDNCSSIDLNLDKVNEYNFSCHVKIFRNKYHIGPDASVVRALELGDSDWVYLLGDSKLPVENVFEIMLKDCFKYNMAWGIVYSFDRMITQPVLINSLEAIPIKYGDFFLGGNSLISKKSLKKYLSLASQLTITRMSHAVFHIMPLCNKEEVYLSSDKIMKEFLEKPSEYDPKLSLLECWAQFSLILLLPVSIKNQKIINRLIVKDGRIEDRIIFLKFSLLAIFRYKKDIRSHLKKIILYRYLYMPFSLEKWLIVYPMYVLSLLTVPFNREKN
jgi:glycosyltransferase involved in cell wall biosynthesis